MRLFADEPVSAPSFFKANRRFDVIAQDGFAGVDIAAEQGFDAFAQQRITERRVCLHARPHGRFEVSYQSHVSPLQSFALFVIGPARLGRVNVSLLVLFGATCQQNEQDFSIESEINPIAGPKINEA